jgi:[ribosomal protein S18]-alanine N-acetyltransferase
MRVRTATLEDVPRLVALLRANATAAQWTEEQFAKMFEEGEGRRVILVIEATQIMRVEGFAVAHEIGPECEIENIVVNPERQRRGFGQNLLKELLNRVRINACEAVFLEVRESNRAARGLYEKCGFQEVGRRVKYYVQPQEDAVVYRFCWTAIASGMVQT